MVEPGCLTVELPPPPPPPPSPPSPTMELWVELVDGIGSVVGRATQNECDGRGGRGERGGRDECERNGASDANDANDGTGVERYFGSKEAKTTQPVQMYLRL